MFTFFFSSFFYRAAVHGRAKGLKGMRIRYNRSERSPAPSSSRLCARPHQSIPHASCSSWTASSEHLLPSTSAQLRPSVVHACPGDASSFRYCTVLVLCRSVRATYTTSSPARSLGWLRCHPSSRVVCLLAPTSGRNARPPLFTHVPDGRKEAEARDYT